MNPVREGEKDWTTEVIRYRRRLKIFFKISCYLHQAMVLWTFAQS